MEECQHCGETFEEETPYLEHLRDEHADELGAIEQRRVAQLDDGGDVPDTILYAAVGVGALLIALVAYAFLSGGGGGGGDAEFQSGSPFEDDVTEPQRANAHYHGTISVTIGGQELDFSRQEYQLQDNAFHFENGNGDRWHGHANRITLEYALETLGIGVTENRLTFDGTTYNASHENTTLVYEVNGQSVNPEEYVLSEGDSIVVVAERE